MNKAAPWNINGVGFDAREAARDAARRQGKSLGEWLHAVIADHATELGVGAQEIAGQDRIDAVTAKLERMSRRPQDFERRDRRLGGEPIRTRPAGRRPIDPPDYEDERAPKRVAPVPHDDFDDMPEPRRARRQAPMIEETEFLLEEAIDSMERRARKAERRTDEALASFAKILETNESKRERERDAVHELSQKLSNIESKLTDRLGAAADNPIKGALARLEARLETIGRRNAAEAPLKLSAAGDALGGIKEIDRLEEKLNSILDAVHGKAPSAPAPAAPAAEARAGRRLGDAIAEISRRQRMLEDPNAVDVAPAPATSAPALLRRRVEASFSAEHSFRAMQSEIAGLAGKFEEMRRDVVDSRAARAAEPIDLDLLRNDIAAMSRTLRDLAPRGDVSALQESITVLAERVETSRDRGVRDAVLQPIEDVISDLRTSLSDIDPRATLGLLEKEIGSISGKVGGLAGADALPRIQEQMQEIRDLLSSAAERPLPVEQIERQVAGLAQRMDHLSAHSTGAAEIGPAANDIRAMIANLPGAASLQKIETRLEALADKVDDAIHHAGAPSPRGPEVASLERLLRDLGTKIDAVQRPGAATPALDDLQRQIALLSARFEKSEKGLEGLGQLERSMRDLFTHLEKTRTSVETSAARAAQEVLRIAMDEGKGTRGSSDHDVAVLKAMQADADDRTQSTLTAVHETLEKVVDRLALMETDIAQVRRRPAEPVSQPAILPAASAAPSRKPPPSPERPTPQARPTVGPSLSLDSADPMIDSLFGRKDRVKKPMAPEQKAKPILGDEETGRADYIAAARRAAQAAQSDPSFLAMKQQAAAAPDARAGLAEKSRDYVATHKKPVLLSLAALLFAFGTLAMMQRLDFGAGATRVADISVPAKITRMADATAPRAVTAARGDLSPSALPAPAPSIARPIPGSDPIQTASIPSLPSFAAGAPAAAPPQPALPAGLKTMAAAGDGAAEYELATRYAEGKAVPRDLTQAAKWYAKAADQGIAPAQYRLAALYEKGLGIAKDKAKAKSLYIQAADAGNPRAMHNLAVLLADGDGRPDYANALIWFRKAAQYGVHDSQYNLAILLARGLGTEQSLVQSYQWFAVAAAQNDVDAAKKRDEVGDKLSANDLAVAKALAASFQPRTASAAATEVQPPPGGWDGVGTSSQINSPRSKISSL